MCSPAGRCGVLEVQTLRPISLGGPVRGLPSPGKFRGSGSLEPYILFVEQGGRMSNGELARIPDGILGHMEKLGNGRQGVGQQS